MILHLPVPWEKYQSAVTAAKNWEQTATELLAGNGVLAAKVEGLAGRLTAANSAAEGLRTALNAGAETSAASEARDLSEQIRALGKQIAGLEAQLAAKHAAWEATEKALGERDAELVRVVEQRNTALDAVERLSRKGGWTPMGVAS